MRVCEGKGIEGESRRYNNDVERASCLVQDLRGRCVRVKGRRSGRYADRDQDGEDAGDYSE